MPADAALRKENAGAPPAITLESRVVLRETTLVRHPDRAPMLGCMEVKSFIEVDDDTLAAIDAIRGSATLGEAEAALLARTGEAYDLVDLVGFLVEKGFVRELDGKPVVNKAVKQGGRTYFANVRPETVRWIRRPALLWTAAAICLAGLVAVAVDRSLRPTFADLFVVDRPSLVLLASFAGMLANTYVHELAHLFMARSYGIDASIRLSHRMHILVMETDVTNAWTLPPRQRALIFLAGMGYNLLAASSVILVLAAGKLGLVELSAGWVAFLKFFGFLNLFPLMFQFFVFMRTDLYFVLLCLTGERNLLKDSRAYLAYAGRRAWARVRGAPARACLTCRHPVLADDPFCHGCGKDQPVADPNKYPFRYSSRWTLALYGLAVVLLTPWMMFRIATGVIGFQLGMLWRSAQDLMAALVEGAYLLAAESTIVFAITGLQVGMLAYFIVPTLARPILPAVRVGARKARHLATPAAGRRLAIGAVVGLVALGQVVLAG